MSDQKFFKTLFRGRFAPEALEVRLVEPGSSLRRSQLSDAWIEGAWQEFIRQGNKPWPGDLLPKRYRLVDLVIGQDDRIILTADPCVSYHDFIGTQSPAFAEKFGDEFVSKAIAVSALLRTSDNKTLITVREKRTDYKWHGWHASTGGFWEIARNDGTKETPTMAALSELHEEAGVEPSEVAELLLLGAVHNPWTAHPDLIYSATTLLTSSEILTRKHDDENSLLFVETEADSYSHWITGAAHASVVVPLAAMMWAGEDLFGYEWANGITEFLAEESRDYHDVATRTKLEKRDIAKFAEMVTFERQKVDKAA